MATSRDRGRTAFLPVLNQPLYRRCHWACGHDCSRPVASDPRNETFASVVTRALSRRSLLRAAGASTLVVAAGAAPAQAHPEGHGRGRAPLGFEPVQPNRADAVVVPRGYASEVVIRWGDPILPGAPEFDFDRQSARAQAGQFGYNNDMVAFFPLPWGSGNSRLGLLAVNHEYTNPEMMFREYDPASPTREQVDIELAAHGVSVVLVERRGYPSGPLRYRRFSRYNRRVTGDTVLRVSGPAAGHPLLRTAADPSGRWVRGTLNNCAGGVTPWGTYLTCEENFNQYFANASAVRDPRVAAWHQRYGLPDGPSERRWERYHRRFDLAQEPHEPFRFGWVVELDPYDPAFIPVKRTALGRMKHEGAETTLSRDRRAVVYMGDDERFEYMFKFVSRERYRPWDRRHNLRLLDEGTLYVATFEADAAGRGVGRWIPLVHGYGPLTAANGFESQADVLINPRRAGDLVGATRMDRPEDMGRNPVTGAVYAICTNNTNRTAAQVDPANPRPANRFGHVIEIRERDGDPAATEFEWEIFLLCGDPADPSTYFAGYPKDRVSPIGSPDNLTFDRAGNLWLATDGTQPLGTNNGFFACPVAGPERGHLQLFLTVPVGAETCGPAFTPDNRSLLVAVQHPGEGGTAAAPLSTFPDGGPPKPAVVSVWRAAKGDPTIGR